MVTDFVTPWTVACQAPLSVEFSRQGYWSELPFPTLGGLPDPGIKPASLASPGLTGSFFTTRKDVGYFFLPLTLQYFGLVISELEDGHQNLVA